MRTALAMGGAAVAGAAVLAFARGGGAEVRVAEPVTVAAAADGNPTAALAPDGGGWAAWIASPEDVANVFAARVGADGSLAQAVRVNDVPGDAAPHEQAPARIATGADGALYVVWQNNTRVEGRRFPASDLRFSRSADGGGTWSPAVTVNDDAGGVPSSHTFHDLLAGPDGTVWVSWIDSRVRDAARASAPAGGGHAHDGLPPSEIRVARSADGGRSFEPSVVVDTGPCPCCRTAMAAGPDGALYVAWRKELAGSVRDVVVARLAPGAAAFDAPVRVHADGWEFPACPHAGPALAVDGEGRLHAGWYTGKEGRQGLWLVRSRDGGRTFGAPVPLLLGDAVPPSTVSLANVGGRVVAAWDDRAARPARIRLGTVGADGGVREHGGGWEGRLPSLASAGGAALVVWQAGDTVRALRLTSD